jgi:non-homologous end joining protein Ku
MPAGAVDPIYFDKAYYLGPDKRGGKPYNLLAEAMRKTGTCALAQWVWKGKQYMVHVRAIDEGLGSSNCSTLTRSDRCWICTWRKLRSSQPSWLWLNS